MLRSRDLLIGTVLALSAAGLFAMLGPVSRFAAVVGVGAIAFVAWRGLIGAVSMGATILARGAMRESLASVRALDGRGRSALATAALMGVTLNLAMFVAFSRIPIALALMLFYTYPAGVASVDLLLGRERATPPKILALGLASFGVVLVLAGGLGAEGGMAMDPLGIALALGASASQVVFMTVSRHGYGGVPTDTATFILLSASGLVVPLIAVLAGQGADLLTPLRSLEPWPLLLLSGVLAAALSSFLFLSAIRRIGSTRTGILMLSEPVLGSLLAAVLLAEALGWLQGVGGAMVLVGAMVLQLSTAPEHDPIAEETAGPLV
jgi:drug/metabolite transporter, DME family